jgi:uncharacterized protein Yka (UPF0111/DUF47 family)
MKTLRSLAVLIVMMLGLSVMAAAQDDTFYSGRGSYTRDDLKRIVKQLEDDVDALAKDYEKFLNTKPNRPRERDLLANIQAFERATDRFEDRFEEVNDPRILTPEAEDIIRQGNDIEDGLQWASPNTEVQEDWRRVRVGLEHLMNAYSLDRAGQPRRRVMTMDEVRRIVLEIEDIGDDLKRDLKKFLNRTRQTPTSRQLEAEWTAFERASDDLKKRAKKVHDPRAIEPEVRAFLERGWRVDDLMRRAFVSNEVLANWARIRAQLELLSSVYGPGYAVRY